MVSETVVSTEAVKGGRRGEGRKEELSEGRLPLPKSNWAEDDPRVAAKP